MKRYRITFNPDQDMSDENELIGVRRRDTSGNWEKHIDDDYLTIGSVTKLLEHGNTVIITDYPETKTIEVDSKLYKLISNIEK